MARTSPKFRAFKDAICGLGSFVVAISECSGTLPADACPAPSPLPSGPSAITVSATTFTAYTTTGKPFTVDFWRDACPGTTANSILYVRIGVGGECDSGTITQGGVQYQAYLYPACASLATTPITNTVEFDYRDPSWLNGGAVTLTLKNVNFQSQGSLPAYTGGGGGGAGGAITPQVGLWWNPNESGSGYAIDLQHGVIVVTIYSYNSDGTAQWYLMTGPLVNNTVSGPLQKFRGGQCISCAYQNPVPNGSDGTMTIAFTSAKSATATLPGGRSFTIVIPSY